MSCLLEDISTHLGYCHVFEGMLNFLFATFIPFFIYLFTVIYFVETMFKIILLQGS